MQSRGRTLHTCSHHSLFSKLNFNFQLLVRTRVQSIAFERPNFYFDLAFAMLFESITKPQREAQKLHSECILFNFTRIL